MPKNYAKHTSKNYVCYSSKKRELPLISIAFMVQRCIVDPMVHINFKSVYKCPVKLFLVHALFCIFFLLKYGQKLDQCRNNK